MLAPLKDFVRNLGKPRWRALLSYIANLHEESIHGPSYYLPYRWEETGCQESLTFGGLETVHISLDALLPDPQHSLYQILNLLSQQLPDGLIPTNAYFKDKHVQLTTKTTFPPLWPVIIDDYIEHTSKLDTLSQCLLALEKQIHWFEKNRKCERFGFYYLDLLDRFWESGVVEGVRYDAEPKNFDEIACVDACSHLYQLYELGSRWSELLGIMAMPWVKRAEEMKLFIQNELYDKETCFFYDEWAMRSPSLRRITFEGLSPLITGAATFEQADRLIDRYILNEAHFFTAHPLPTVSLRDPYFDTWGWRGPVRNSVTYWVARGALKYGRKDAARALLERALDATEHQFEKTGSIFEIYHPHNLGSQHLRRDKKDTPLVNHLGTNPLIAMAALWERVS